MDAALKIQDLDETLWLMKEQQLCHALFTNFEENGVKLFVELFSEAGDLPTRKKLFDHFQKYEQRFQPKHRTIRDIHQIKLWNSEKEHYQEAINLCEKLLQQQRELSEEHTIELLIEQGNLTIRLARVADGLNDFEKSLKKSEDGYKKGSLLPLWLIISEKETGWAYRLVGSLKKAEQHYQQARTLCVEHDAPTKKDLQKDYVMILNNLAFVRSNKRTTRETAKNYADAAIEHSQKFNYQKGLGAGYYTKGIILYRNGEFSRALEEFEKAVEIFQRLQQTDWLGQVYAWRGATYRGLEEYQKADDDLNKALKIGAENLKAMIFNRLGRVYMSLGKKAIEEKKLDIAEEHWGCAEDYLRESIEWAKKIPDPIYELVSLSRLIMIAAEKEFQKKERNAERISNELNSFYQQLKEYLKRIEGITEPDQNNEGIAYIALARLAFRQNDHSQIIEYLKKGIDSIIEYGSYADRNEMSRLKVIEGDFKDTDPKTIQHVGKALLEYALEKQHDNSAYDIIFDLMYSWAHWGK